MFYTNSPCNYTNGRDSRPLITREEHRRDHPYAGIADTAATTAEVTAQKVARKLEKQWKTTEPWDETPE